MNNHRTLVAYFSCTGTTKKAAEKLAGAAGADLFEIRPQTPYSRADLNWNSKQSRSSVEMNDPASRPAIAEKLDGMERYDAVFVGFPIWWYTAPRIIASFLESYDFSGKTVIPFATSGGSGMGSIDRELIACCAAGTKWKTGKLLGSGVDATTLQSWVRQLDLP